MTDHLAERVLQVEDLKNQLCVARSALQYVLEEGLTADATLEDLQGARKAATDALSDLEVSSDLDVMKTLLDRAGIVYAQDPLGLAVEAHTGPKNKGFEGFEAFFTFRDGKLDSVIVSE